MRRIDGSVLSSRVIAVSVLIGLIILLVAASAVTADPPEQAGGTEAGPLAPLHACPFSTACNTAGWAYQVRNGGTGHGILGYASNTTDNSNIGVYGLSNSPSGGRGVYGYNARYRGVEGATASGIGVYGNASGTGAGINYGVYGLARSTLGRGVYGTAPYIGVQGVATATSGGRYGVYGSSSYIGVYGTSTFIGVYGRTTAATGAYAGYFVGDVRATDDLTVGDDLFVTGTKSSVVKAANGERRALYAIESPTVVFEDFGSAQLVNGEATVKIEALFAETVNTNQSYFIFLTPNGDSKGLYVAEKQAGYFVVREQNGGQSNIAFDYRIVAKRKGYEDVRLSPVTDDTAALGEEVAGESLEAELERLAAEASELDAQNAELERERQLLEAAPATDSE
jgi:hypothetical protein